MELTSRELKQIERLRKQERQWPRNRWMLLGAGIFSGAGSIYISVSIYRLFSPSTDATPLDNVMIFSGKILVFAMFWPQCLLMGCVSAWLIVQALLDWHGNINRRLLLKLLDAQQSQSPSPGNNT